MATEFELQVLSELSEIKSVGAATTAKVDALDTRLFNGGTGVIHNLQQDIQEIIDERQEEQRWNRLHNILHYSIAPILVFAHALARKLGVNV